MANKSGVAEQVLTLPKGGGAVTGMGEKFQPDLYTGTANLVLPIALPAGRNNFQPDLAITYSTGHSNGPLGMGWQLGVPSVSRKSSKGIPRYRNDSPRWIERDTFILTGNEDLVLVRENNNAGPGADETHCYYRPRGESLFSRIRQITSAATNRWEIYARSGLVSVFGGNPSARVFDERRPDRIFAWLLSETRDTFGNRIVYTYKRDLGQRADGTSLAADGHWYEADHDYNQTYLSRIDYVNYRIPGDVADRYLFNVVFDYGEFSADGEEVAEWEYRTEDPFSTYRAGFEIRTVRRCKRVLIRMKEHDQAKGRLVKAYDFSYQHSRLNAASQLRRIDVRGYSPREPGDQTGDVLPDGTLVTNQYRVQSMAPSEFAYTDFVPEAAECLNLRAREDDLPERAIGHPEFELIDLEGYGLPGVLHTTRDGHRYWQNLGDGLLNVPQPLAQAPVGVTLGDDTVQLADMNGDGRTDLLVNDVPLSGYYSTTFGAGWNSFQPYNQSPSFDLSDPNVKLVDMNGDGVVDALATHTHFEIFYNRGPDGWDLVPQHVPRGPLEEFPDVYFDEPSGRIRLASMTGSGQDIVAIYDGRIDYWPHIGYGEYGRRITFRNSPRFGYEFDPKHVILSDVDGDGLADLVYVGFDCVWLCINQSGVTWSDPVRIAGTPPMGDADSVRGVDMLGSGTAGLLFSYDFPYPSGSNYKFLDLTNGTKPYLLCEMRNNLGSATRIDYRPSTWFYLQDIANNRPWLSHLPFPVQCVSRVERLDEISGLKVSSDYSYHHGHWDGEEHEPRGFGCVTQRDTHEFNDYHSEGLFPGVVFNTVVAEAFAAPIETRTWFHQGADESGKEFDFRGEYWFGDPQVLTRPPAVAALLDLLPPADRRQALRILRGTMLRSESYSPDGSGVADRPYTVTEQVYGLREEAIAGPGDQERARVVFPFLASQRTSDWQRGNEPKTSFTFFDGFDEYGMGSLSLTVAVPRSRDFRAGSVPGDPYLAILVDTSYARRDAPGTYIVDRTARARSYEILNDGSQNVYALRDSALAPGSPRRLLSEALTFYDGPAFQGLPFGQIGDYGSPVRTEMLTMTSSLLEQIYRTGNAVLNPPELPPYLDPQGAPWTNEYPAAFRGALAPLAGYAFHIGGGPSEYSGGYYVQTERREYDFQAGGVGRGTILVKRDPLGHDATIVYDSYEIEPTSITDQAGLTTTVSYEYRCLGPREITDPNGNRQLFQYTPLGFVDCIVLQGKLGENLGDSIHKPTTKFSYDYLAFIRDRKPTSVRTVQRLHHSSDLAVPDAERDETLQRIEYSDGFGRVIQSRTQSEDLVFGDRTFGDSGLVEDQTATVGDAAGVARLPGDSPNVAVSAWQVFDNKGRVIRKFEPFLTSGFDYSEPTLTQLGHVVKFFYDALGRAVRTVAPDGSETRTVYGIPLAINQPGAFAPTPWEYYLYDANDNGGRTHPASSVSYASHWNTPSSFVIDPLGRIIETIQRNGPNPLTDWHLTRSAYDIQSKLLSVTDALGRVAIRYEYNLAGNALRIESIDAGARRMIVDAVANEIERRDSRGTLILQSFDSLHRPVRLWARDHVADALTLREYFVYGDDAASGLTTVSARATNLLNKYYKQYDEAGLLTTEHYDFRGNILEKERRLIRDSFLLSGFPPGGGSPPGWQVQGFRVNWEPAAGTSFAAHVTALLEPQSYRTTASYDALRKPLSILLPSDINGARPEIKPQYNRGGTLEQIHVDGTTYVQGIAYNAKGQITLIAYGNGLMTRYAYDSQNCRLARARTEAYQVVATGNMVRYHPPSANPALVDTAYEYDLSGNLLAMHERTADCGLPMDRDRLDRLFTYDALYRLLTATGREHDQIPVHPWDALPRCAHASPALCVDVTRARPYTERYRYDDVGNMRELAHQAGASSYVRTYSMGAGSNRVSDMSVGAKAYAYSFDEAGNLLRENTERHLEWDHNGRLRAFRVQPAGAPPSIYAAYLYDYSGQRLKKVVRKSASRVDTTVYIDGFFEHHRWQRPGTAPAQNNQIHVLDGTRRVCSFRIGPAHPDDSGPTVQYVIGDHLQSSTLVIDDVGNWTNREEYLPFGETSYGSFSRKRFRYGGKERDEESGLYAFAARHYAPWLARWVSPDPIGMVDGPSLYAYVVNNPMRRMDTTGAQSDPTPDEVASQQTQTCEAPSASDTKLTCEADPPETASTTSPTPTRVAPSPSSQVANSIEHSRRYAPLPVTAGTDPGRMRITGVRDPTMTGTGLAPRDHYNNPNAASAAAAGFTNWAELVEAGHGCSACHVTHNIGRIPTNEELDLGRYNDVAVGVYATKAILEFVLAVGQARAQWEPSPPAPNAPNTAPRLPQDANVNPTPPPAKPLNRPISTSPTQNAEMQQDIARMRAQGATDVRVNQQQVNANGQRVGTNRPDLQATDSTGQITGTPGKRVYVEYDRPGSVRGPQHQQRIQSNDSQGHVILKTTP